MGIYLKQQVTDLKGNNLKNTEGTWSESMRVYLRKPARN